MVRQRCRVTKCYSSHLCHCSVTNNEETTKMPVTNLSMIFGPTLMTTEQFRVTKFWPFSSFTYSIRGFNEFSPADLSDFSRSVEVQMVLLASTGASMSVLFSDGVALSSLIILAGDHAFVCLLALFCSLQATMLSFLVFFLLSFFYFNFLKSFYLFV